MTNIENLAQDLFERPMEEQQLIEFLRMMDDWKAQQCMDDMNVIECSLKSKCNRFSPITNDLPF
jgi:hypothetical protein